MYRTSLDTKDKGGALMAVALVHVGLFFMLLQLSGKIDLTDPQGALDVFDVTEVPPPPPPEQPVVQRTQAQQKPEAKEGAASPKNIRSTATEIVSPRPQISLPVPVPMATTTTPNTGTEATQGASDVVGPGTGAGGIGTGTGSGGAGNGTGGGGGGGYLTPPQLLSPVLRGRDFPRQLIDAWPRGAEVFTRLRVSPSGAVIQCIVDRGTGNPQIDATICSIVQQRFRFNPALDKSRRPVAGWFGYRQVPPR
ncbi:energy transducer TonB [Sphingomonas sabuli]|uniref:Energy transducer TonB n=1 Tax=Sphingomonas sabuli TaxID=2764186 RepID=A0A7G9L031_9SPHN|nr:energy transducer TonB [Sphingomonas sabuli]QNM81980.1 energy transducer TonB [Sphingomonas sabuli]